MESSRGRVLVVGYLAAAVLANLLVYFLGPRFLPVGAFVLVGLDLTARDLLHEQWEKDRLALRMTALVAGGSILSALANLGAWRIALASFVAFAIAGFTDVVVYHLLRRQPRLHRILGSNTLSALADSILFPWIAFGLLSITASALQFLAKILGGAVWGLVLVHTLERRRR